MDGDDVAGVFGLGEPVGVMVETARGWGGHNVVYRLGTTSGRWAVKVLVRELDDLMAERFEIEVAAFAGGVPMPRPVPVPAQATATAGSPCVPIGGVLVRCHEWVEGTARENEATSVVEAGLMGALVAQLHQLALAWSSRFDDQLETGEDQSWMELARAGGRRNAPWAAVLTERLPAVERLAATVEHLRDQTRRLARVGSHRDLNAHNVLFTPAGLSLIDWDAAGPTFPPWERANYATLWSSRHGGRYDLAAAMAFLRGYRDAGGEIAAEDPGTLEYLLDDIESWTKKNVRWAVESPSDGQDLHTGLLIDALLATPATIDERRRLLEAALSRLRSAP